MFSSNLLNAFRAHECRSFGMLGPFVFLLMHMLSTLVMTYYDFGTFSRLMTRGRRMLEWVWPGE